jgi:type IX secretion system PorP/SprF family membrane protein
VKKKYSIFILAVLFPLITRAQYIPVFSDYVSNGLLINPAYAGSREVLSLSFLFRDQWAGFDGSPIYETFGAHAPLKNANIGIGFLLMNEKSGPTVNTQAYFNYAYRIRMGSGKLALGLKAGINYTNNDWSNLNLIHPDDLVFSNNTKRYILPNFGVGVYYLNQKVFAGFSIPFILSFKENSAGSGYQIYHDINNYNYLFTTGYLFDISRDFKLKPSLLLKYNAKIKQQLDLNMNFILLNDKLWIGTAYRIKEALSSSFEIQVNPQLRFGYAFDYSGGQVNYFKYTSHEIFVRYEFSYKIKAFNPRYF